MSHAWKLDHAINLTEGVHQFDGGVKSLMWSAGRSVLVDKKLDRGRSSVPASPADRWSLVVDDEVLNRAGC